jgi:hypothetical protein
MWKDNTKLTGFEETLQGSLVDSADSGWGQVVSICERDNRLAGFAEHLELLGELKASTDGCLRSNASMRELGLDYSG